MMNRQTKRVLNQLCKKAGYGKYVIDCRYHPCLVVEVDRDSRYPYQDGCSCRSLINGRINGCSYLHCGIEPITKALAEEMAEFANNNNFYDYLIKYHGYNEEGRKDWEKLDKEWDFEKSKPRVQRISGSEVEDGGPTVQSILE